MSTPSPFQTALAVGNNIASGFRNYQDRTAIDDILEKAHQTGNPEDIDYAMTKILSRVSPERQQVALALLQKKRANIESNNEKARLKQALKAQGLPEYVADYPPEMQKQYFKQLEENRKRKNKKQSYVDAKLPEYYADLDPLTQRTLIQKQSTDDLFNQILGNVSPQSYTPIDSENAPLMGPEGSPNIRVINGVPSVFVPQEEANAMGQEGVPEVPAIPQMQQAPMDMTQTLNQFSPAPQQQPQGMERFSDQQLVAFRGLKGNPISAMADAELRRRQEDRKLNADTKKQDRKEQLEFHRESADYDKEVMKKANIAKKQIEAVKNIRKSVKSGKVKPRSISNFFSGLGTIGDKVASAFKSAEQGEFEAAIPLLVEGWKDVFGTRITDADLRLIQTKLPNISNSPEANESILNVIEKYARPHLIRDEVASEIKKKYKDLRPLGFERMVEEETQKRLEAATPTGEKIVRVQTPDGRIKKVPVSKLDEALRMKAKVLE